jgi:tetratricopeptide (TPR) repeat protein
MRGIYGAFIKLHWSPVVLLALATFLVFGRVLSADLVKWDDDINIYRNVHLSPLSWSSLVWMFTDSSYVVYYAPLSWLNVFVVYTICGLNPLGYHLSNLLFHLGNTLLVYVLIKKCLSLVMPQRAKWIWPAIVGALLWGLHPLRAEAVAWATGISYCQSTFFLLCSCLFYLEPAVRKDRVAWKWYFASLLAYALSLFTYPIGLTWPLLLLVVDFFVLKPIETAREGGWKRDLVSACTKILPFLALSAVFIGVTLYRRSQAHGLWSPPVTLEEFSLLSRIMQAFYIWAYFIFKPIFPTGLAPVYPELLQFDAFDLIFLISALFVLGLTAFLVWKRLKLLLAVWLCYLVLLIPYLGLTEHPHFTCDRYNYLAAVVWSVLIAAALLKWGESTARVWSVKAVSYGCILLLGTLAFRQTGIWHDTMSLFSYTVDHIPEGPYKADFQNRFGLYFLEQQEFALAEKQFNNALKFLPNSVFAHYGLAQVLWAKGERDQALLEFEKALTNHPPLDEIYYRKGVLLSEMGRTAEAAAAYRECLRVNPKRADALNNLAWILTTTSDSSLRNGNEAVRLAEKACELTKYTDPLLIGTLAAAYAEAERFPEAVGTAQKAISIASSSGQSNLVVKNTRLLKSYQAGRKWTE